MKLTTKSEYSLLALIYLARAGAGEFVKIEDICTHYSIPKKYLEQLLSVLKQSGFIQAKRGASGGYTLARDPGLITLAAVIRQMDGALAPTQSVSQYFFTHTPLEKEKKVLSVFQDIRDIISDRMEKTTIADLL
jgi:Rrf2 family protein